MSASRPVSALSALSTASEMEKPRTRAKAAPKKTTTRTTTRKRAETTTKKPAPKIAATTKATKAKSTKKAKVALPDRPTWKDIIKECIVDNKDDARVGVSRSTIKKFAEERYGVEMSPLNLFQLGRAIASGTESGMFVLPKGPSGKVKLAPKTSRPASKENSKPVSKTTKKPTAAKPASKKTTTTKVLASKGGAKASNKTSSSARQRNSSKKTVTGVTPAVKAQAAARKKTSKKTVARK